MNKYQSQLAESDGAGAPLSSPHPEASQATMLPRATLRLQLHREFDFAAARRLVPYAAALGISHLYVSPS
jgi:(1->4)-alpha-D-glucan 1-alpha-D-glucosylmutase